MIGGLGPNELLVILIIAFILFGAHKLPELARSLGRATGEFKKAQREAEIELRKFEEELKAGKYKSQDEKRKKLEEIARTLNIDPEGKSDEELIEEINKALPKEKVEP
ncbi:twin-arginine translocase TatA/TatE family subunit [Ferroglobus sp.]|uniref:Sec-independent protein translocase subunit TatA/TatB n=1 Tax=Ferroglobus sp. TaxID=2614230 RepID=UPI0025C10BC4|nr:twin-arginine translocase TatA/TatE family subunit [Ferroglobus sp.]